MTTDGTEEASASSAFKRAHARYRRQAHAPDRLDDVSELLDFSRGGDDRILPIRLTERKHIDIDVDIDYYRGPIYGLKGFPGFLYAPQSLSDSLQVSLAHSAVSQYCEAPHVTNIDSVPPKPSEELNTNDSMWSLWKEENGCGNAKTAPYPRKQSTSTRKYRSFRKLSWATMGYHYDWTSRAYHEGAKSAMPDQLEKVAQLFAKTSLLVEGSVPPVRYAASACIVNYYNNKSIMGGHRDDLELALDKPIVSLSMGRPAVFLLGGKTKDCSPIVPILIRPGDVMVMGGDCRLNYHSMARLLPDTKCLPSIDVDRVPAPTQQVPSTLEAGSPISMQDERALQAFLEKHRININVRQVYPDGD
jgi:alkylated DNA repair protein alkB family protein 1